MLQPTRVCARCHAEKPLEAFPIKDQIRGTRRSYCLPCCRAYGKEHYQRNKPCYLQKNVAAKVSHRLANLDLVYEYLLRHPCVDCGKADPVVLDFDHVDPKNKLWTVGKMLARQATPAVRREIDKCAVRCANCHRMRTAKQFGSYRLQETGIAYGC